MQITKAEVIPVELTLRKPLTAYPHSHADSAIATPRSSSLSAPISHVTAIFVRLETRQGQSAWGCTVAHPQLTGESPDVVLNECCECAKIAPDLHPLNLEYSLDELQSRVQIGPSAQCAFDLALHDLFCLAAGMPLYRILGGYRSRIQTSVTIPISPIDESVDLAEQRARDGFRILKVKGGADPAEDVRRVQAIHQALPNHLLRLDADGGYSTREALDVARALEGSLEMLEQPTPADDLAALREVKEISPIPILADQSVRGPASALELAAHKAVDGMSVKLATCGGLRCARQIDSIARAAHLATMVGCFVEPALLIAAGLGLALSGPSIRYGDLDGSFDLLSDPSRAGFSLQDGWLVASDVPGLGYTVEL